MLKRVILKEMPSFYWQTLGLPVDGARVPRVLPPQKRAPSGLRS